NFKDENRDNNLTVNLNADIKLGAKQTLTGEATVVNVRARGSIQDAVYVIKSGASADAKNTINVYAGDYVEGNVNVDYFGAKGGQKFGLHVFKDNFILQGVDENGVAIENRVATQATIT